MVNARLTVFDSTLSLTCSKTSTSKGLSMPLPARSSRVLRIISLYSPGLQLLFGRSDQPRSPASTRTSPSTLSPAAFSTQSSLWRRA